MDRQTQARKAELFRQLHHASDILVVGNAWDAVSAKIFEQEGFAAIATTSAGVAATFGYPDGQKAPLEALLDAISRISRCTDLPVTVDFESGYADTAEAVAENVRRLLNVGAVGINLEDSFGHCMGDLYPAEHHVAKIEAIRRVTKEAGIPMVINARTDAYMLMSADKGDRLSAAVDRARRYVEAGADCVFVPDLEDLESDDIAFLAESIPAPLNIIAGAKTPPLAELQKLGVARVSLGPRPMRAMLAKLRTIAKEIQHKGTFNEMNSEALTYAEVNAMFEPAKIVRKAES